MEIGGIGVSDGMWNRQKTEINSMDIISKNIQKELSDIQRQKQEVSFKDDISVEEKAKKRKELQQEISRLNRELRQRQAEVRREQNREALLDERRTEGLKDTGSKTMGNDINDKENVSGENELSKYEEEITGINDIKNLMAVDSDVKQEITQGRVIAKMEEGIVILRGELKQDETRGENVEKKKEEIKEQEERVQGAIEFKFPDIGSKSEADKEEIQINIGGKKNEPESGVSQDNDGKVIVNTAIT